MATTSRLANTQTSASEYRRTAWKYDTGLRAPQGDLAPDEERAAQRQDREQRDRDEGLGRVEVGQAAAERHVGEHLGGRANDGARRHVGETQPGQPGAVVDEAVRQQRHDPRLHHRYAS